MKTFQVVYIVSDVSNETIYVKADEIYVDTQGVKLTTSDNTIIAFFPFENLIGVTDSENLDTSNSE